MGWVTADPPTRAELSACVQCGLCLPHCPTFRLTGLETASPRGRLAAMEAVAAGLASVDAEFDRIMSFCLQCRACEPVCPGLVPFGRAMEGARAELTAQLPTPTRRGRHRLLASVLEHRGRLRALTFFAALAQRRRLGVVLPGRLRRGLGGLRPLPGSVSTLSGRTFEPRGPAHGEVALLAGCVMEQWFEDVHLAAVRLLTAAGLRVVVPAGQGCCGALAVHDGAIDLARSQAARNLTAFAGAELVVADAAGCSAHLKDYEQWVEGGGRLASRARDLVEVIADLIESGLLPRLPASGVGVAVQDPCHLRHAQRVVGPPRVILESAGLVPVEVDPDGMCCGAAGLYSLLQPEASTELGRRKARQVLATGARLVATANPGCEMQLRSLLPPEVRVAHPVELYLEALTRDGMVT